MKKMNQDINRSAWATTQAGYGISTIFINAGNKNCIKKPE
jgi:hypothetical protein